MLVHLEDLLKIQKKTYIRLKDGFREKLFETACKNLNGSLCSLAKTINKQFDVQCFTTLYYWYKGMRYNGKYTKIISSAIPLDILTFVANLAKTDMREVEQNIDFIKGDARAYRIFDPKFPIKLNKAAAATISHILHNGYLEERKLRVVYSNKNQDNLEHFKQNIIQMFGASKVEFGEIKSKGGIRIDTPNIVGYVLVLFGLKPGNKLKYNVRVPDYLLKCSNLKTTSGYIESLISDEMNVFNSKCQVGGNIGVSLSSLKNKPSQLLLDNMFMFKKFGIKTTKPRLDRIKTTKNGQVRYEWGFFIYGQRNLLTLYSLTTVPMKRKLNKLIKVLKSYTKLHDAIILKKPFRAQLFNEVISKYKTIPKLSDILTSKLGFDISEGSIHDWKKGRYYCPILVIKQLAKICNYSTDDIVKNTLSYKSHGREKPYKPEKEFLYKILTSPLPNSLNRSF